MVNINWKFLNRMFFLIFLIVYGRAFPLSSLSLSSLSLEKKVGQVLMVHVHGQEENEEVKRFIQEIGVGGIIYYSWANGLDSPQQIQNLSQSLQQLACHTTHAVPLLIAVDQEGGVIQRFKKGFTIFPGNYALGQTDEWRWGIESAWMIGKELKAVGVCLNLAPVVDIYTQPANPVIGIRAFSSDPVKVAFWGKYALQGYKQAGIIATLKHFPGHGDVKVDSHEALPVVNKKREELEKIELLPFRTLASQTEMMMTSHLFVPALDAQQCVTFSKKIITDFLREELNFQGVVMTDSLAMEGILSQVSSIEEAALKSLQAGHDLILLGGKQLLASQQGLEFTFEDVKRIHHFLVDAVKQGRLSEQRLDESVGRLLALKQKYGLFDFRSLNPSLIQTQVNTAQHRALAQQISRRALRLVKGQESLPIGLQTEPFVIVAPLLLRDELAQTSWNSLGGNTQLLYFKELNPDHAVIQEIKAAVKGRPCLYFAYNMWQFAGQKELFQQLIHAASRTLTLAVCNPLDTDELATADVVLCTFSPAACSLQAAFDYLTTGER